MSVHGGTAARDGVGVNRRRAAHFQNHHHHHHPPKRGKGKLWPALLLPPTLVLLILLTAIYAIQEAEVGVGGVVGGGSSSPSPPARTTTCTTGTAASSVSGYLSISIRGEDLEAVPASMATFSRVELLNTHPTQSIELTSMHIMDGRYQNRDDGEVEVDPPPPTSAAAAPRRGDGGATAPSKSFFVMNFAPSTLAPGARSEVNIAFLPRHYSSPPGDGSGNGDGIEGRGSTRTPTQMHEATLFVVSSPTNATGGGGGGNCTHTVPMTGSSVPNVYDLPSQLMLRLDRPETTTSHGLGDGGVDHYRVTEEGDLTVGSLTLRIANPHEDDELHVVDLSLHSPVFDGGGRGGGGSGGNNRDVNAEAVADVRADVDVLVHPAQDRKPTVSRPLVIRPGGGAGGPEILATLEWSVRNAPPLRESLRGLSSRDDSSFCWGYLHVHTNRGNFLIAIDVGYGDGGHDGDVDAESDSDVAAAAGVSRATGEDEDGASGDSTVRGGEDASASEPASASSSSSSDAPSRVGGGVTSPTDGADSRCAGGARGCEVPHDDDDAAARTTTGARPAMERRRGGDTGDTYAYSNVAAGGAPIEANVRGGVAAGRARAVPSDDVATGRAGGLLPLLTALRDDTSNATHRRVSYLTTVSDRIDFGTRYAPLGDDHTISPEHGGGGSSRDSPSSASDGGIGGDSIYVGVQNRDAIAVKILRVDQIAYSITILDDAYGAEFPVGPRPPVAAQPVPPVGDHNPHLRVRWVSTPDGHDEDGDNADSPHHHHRHPSATAEAGGGSGIIISPKESMPRLLLVTHDASTVPQSCILRGKIRITTNHMDPATASVDVAYVATVLRGKVHLGSNVWYGVDRDTVRWAHDSAAAVAVGTTAASTSTVRRIVHPIEIVNYYPTPVGVRAVYLDGCGGVARLLDSSASSPPASAAAAGGGVAADFGGGGDHLGSVPGFGSSWDRKFSVEIGPPPDNGPRHVPNPPSSSSFSSAAQHRRSESTGSGRLSAGVGSGGGTYAELDDERRPYVCHLVVDTNISNYVLPIILYDGGIHLSASREWGNNGTGTGSTSDEMIGGEAVSHWGNHRHRKMDDTNGTLMRGWELIRELEARDGSGCAGGRDRDRGRGGGRRADNANSDARTGGGRRNADTGGGRRGGVLGRDGDDNNSTVVFEMHVGSIEAGRSKVRKFYLTNFNPVSVRIRPRTHSLGGLGIRLARSSADLTTFLPRRDAAAVGARGESTQGGVGGGRGRGGGGEGGAGSSSSSSPSAVWRQRQRHFLASTQGTFLGRLGYQDDITFSRMITDPSSSSSSSSTVRPDASVGHGRELWERLYAKSKVVTLYRDRYDAMAPHEANDEGVLGMFETVEEFLSGGGSSGNASEPCRDSGFGGGLLLSTDGRSDYILPPVEPTPRGCASSARSNDCTTQSPDAVPSWTTANATWEIPPGGVAAIDLHVRAPHPALLGRDVTSFVALGLELVNVNTAELIKLVVKYEAIVGGVSMQSSPDGWNGTRAGKEKHRAERRNRRGGSGVKGGRATNVRPAREEGGITQTDDHETGGNTDDDDEDGSGSIHIPCNFYPKSHHSEWYARSANEETESDGGVDLFVNSSFAHPVQLVSIRTVCHAGAFRFHLGKSGAPHVRESSYVDGDGDDRWRRSALVVPPTASNIFVGRVHSVFDCHTRAYGDNFFACAYRWLSEREDARSGGASSTCGLDRNDDDINEGGPMMGNLHRRGLDGDETRGRGQMNLSRSHREKELLQRTRRVLKDIILYMVRRYGHMSDYAGGELGNEFIDDGRTGLPQRHLQGVDGTNVTTSVGPVDVDAHQQPQMQQLFVQTATAAGSSNQQQFMLKRGGGVVNVAETHHQQGARINAAPVSVSAGASTTINDIIATHLNNLAASSSSAQYGAGHVTPNGHVSPSGGSTSQPISKMVLNQLESFSELWTLGVKEYDWDTLTTGVEVTLRAVEGHETEEGRGGDGISQEESSSSDQSFTRPFVEWKEISVPVSSSTLGGNVTKQRGSAKLKLTTKLDIPSVTTLEGNTLLFDNGGEDYGDVVPIAQVAKGYVRIYNPTDVELFARLVSAEETPSTSTDDTGSDGSGSRSRSSCRDGSSWPLFGSGSGSFNSACCDDIDACGDVTNATEAWAALERKEKYSSALHVQYNPHDTKAVPWWSGGSYYMYTSLDNVLLQSNHNITIKSGGGTHVSLINPSMQAVNSFCLGCGKRCNVKNEVLNPEKAHSPIGAASSSMASRRDRSLLVPESLSPTKLPPAFALPYASTIERSVAPRSYALLGPIYFRPPSRGVFTGTVLVENSLNGVEKVTLKGFGGMEKLVMESSAVVDDKMLVESKSPHDFSSPAASILKGSSDIELRLGKPTLVFSGTSSPDGHGPNVKNLVLINGGDTVVDVGKVYVSTAELYHFTNLKPHPRDATWLDAQKFGCEARGFRLIGCSEDTDISVIGREQPTPSSRAQPVKKPRSNTVVRNARNGFTLRPGESTSLQIEHHADCTFKTMYVTLNFEFSRRSQRRGSPRSRNRSNRMEQAFQEEKLEVLLGYDMTATEMRSCRPSVNTSYRRRSSHDGEDVRGRYMDEEFTSLLVKSSFVVALFYLVYSMIYWMVYRHENSIFFKRLLFLTDYTAKSNELGSDVTSLSSTIAANKRATTSSHRFSNYPTSSNWMSSYRCLSKADPNSTALVEMSREQMKSSLLGKFKKCGMTIPQCIMNNGGFVHRCSSRSDTGSPSHSTHPSAGGASAIASKSSSGATSMLNASSGTNGSSVGNSAGSGGAVHAKKSSVNGQKVMNGSTTMGGAIFRGDAIAEVKGLQNSSNEQDITPVGFGWRAAASNNLIATLRWDWDWGDCVCEGMSESSRVRQLLLQRAEEDEDDGEESTSSSVASSTSGVSHDDNVKRLMHAQLYDDEEEEDEEDVNVDVLMPPGSINIHGVNSVAGGTLSPPAVVGVKAGSTRHDETFLLGNEGEEGFIYSGSNKHHPNGSKGGGAPLASNKGARSKRQQGLSKAGTSRRVQNKQHPQEQTKTLSGGGLTDNAKKSPASAGLSTVRASSLPTKANIVTTISSQTPTVLQSNRATKHGVTNSRSSLGQHQQSSGGGRLIGGVPVTWADPGSRSKKPGGKSRSAGARNANARGSPSLQRQSKSGKAGESGTAVVVQTNKLQHQQQLQPDSAVQMSPPVHSRSSSSSSSSAKGGNSSPVVYPDWKGKKHGEGGEDKLTQSNRGGSSSDPVRSSEATPVVEVPPPLTLEPMEAQQQKHNDFTSEPCRERRTTTTPKKIVHAKLAQSTPHWMEGLASSSDLHAQAPAFHPQQHQNTSTHTNSVVRPPPGLLPPPGFVNDSTAASSVGSQQYPSSSSPSMSSALPILPPSVTGSAAVSGRDGSPPPRESKTSSNNANLRPPLAVKLSPTASTNPEASAIKVRTAIGTSRLKPSASAAPESHPSVGGADYLSSASGSDGLGSFEAAIGPPVASAASGPRQASSSALGSDVNSSATIEPPPTASLLWGSSSSLFGAAPGGISGRGNTNTTGVSASTSLYSGFNVENFLEGILNDKTAQADDDENSEDDEHFVVATENDSVSESASVGVSAGGVASSDFWDPSSGEVLQVVQGTEIGALAPGVNVSSSERAVGFGLTVGGPVIGRGSGTAGDGNSRSAVAVHGSPSAGDKTKDIRDLNLPLLAPGAVLGTGNKDKGASAENVEAIAFGTNFLLNDDNSGDEVDESEYQRNSFFANLIREGGN